MLSRNTKRVFSVGIPIVIILSVLSMFAFFGAPNNFPIDRTFLINEGESIKSVSNRLEEEGYVKSALLFRLFLSAYEHDRKLQLGYYQFTGSLTLPLLVHTIITNGPSSPYGKLTVPEGSTDKEIASLIYTALSDLNEKDIILEIQKQNATGFLFPETYYLIPSMTEEEIITRMQAMFIKKVGEVYKESLVSLDTENKNKIIDTVILASVLEGEAKTKEDMKMVSGILLKRLSIGMPLQVDVALETYKIKGLPKLPINNPGLVAIEAALNPIESEYLYYITGKDGKMYYAKTFTEHKKNIQKYLK